MRGPLVAALLCGLAPVAYAAHPLVTDDPNTQGSQRQQIEANTDWGRQDGVDRHVGTVTYSYGALNNLDVFINVPLTFSSPHGINDLSLGAKWRFHENDGLSVAVKPELFLPTGDETKAMGNGRASVKFTGIAAYDAEPWMLLCNIGVSINRYQLQADRDTMRGMQLRASTSAWYSLNSQWKLLGDIGLERSIDKASGAYPGFILGGMMYSPTQNLDLDAGVRFNLRCSTCSGIANRQVGVGLAARF